MPTFRPGKPRFKVLGTNAQALAVGTTTLAWASTAWADGDVTIGGSSVTINVAGLYVIESTFIETTPASSHISTLRLTVNGTAEAAQGRLSAAAQNPLSATLLEELAVGDVLRAEVVVTGNAITVLAPYTHLSGTRIGPVRWTG